MTASSPDATASIREPPTSWADKAKPQVLYTFDKNKANSMLDQAGWTKGSDGIRAKGGTKLKFEPGESRIVRLLVSAHLFDLPDDLCPTGHARG